LSKVVFMGTPDFAAGILQALIDSEYEVTAVFTQPDKPKGRKGILQAPPAKDLAASAGIAVYQPEKIRREENIRILQELAPDFIVVAAYGQIIPKAILDIPKYGILNVHASLLPRWRGAAPIQWSILAGDSETGVTIMQMNEGLDTGDMIAEESYTIRPDETGGSLFDRLMEMGADLLIRTMRSVEAGTATWTKQPAESPTPYAKMLDKSMGEIDWGKSAAQIERQVRALDPWPGTWTHLDGKMLKLWKAEAAAAADAPKGAGPGSVTGTDGGALSVMTGDGVLRITELQLEGKKRMDAEAFLRGYHPPEGSILE